MSLLHSDHSFLTLAGILLNYIEINKKSYSYEKGEIKYFMNKREAFGELNALYREQREAFLSLSEGMILQRIIETIVNGNKDFIYNFMQQKPIKRINNRQTRKTPNHQIFELRGQLAIVALEFFQQYQYNSDNYNEKEFLKQYNRYCKNNLHRQWYAENNKEKIFPEYAFYYSNESNVFTNREEFMKKYYDKYGYDYKEPLKNAQKFDSDFNKSIVDDFQENTIVNMDLKNALKTLTDKEQFIIYLIFDERMSQDEIAIQLNTYQKDVSRKLETALRKLKKYFGEDYNFL